MPLTLPVILINRLPSLTCPKAPFELLFNKLPDYTFLKTFGCECWPYLRPYNSHKFSYRSKSCLFLGYNKPHLGYKCLDLSTGRLYIARHVIFNEQVFPFKSLLGPPPSSAPCQPILYLPTCVSPPLLYHPMYLLYPQIQMPLPWPLLLLIFPIIPLLLPRLLHLPLLVLIP
jgi:hypothetical protein